MRENRWCRASEEISTSLGLGRRQLLGRFDRPLQGSATEGTVPIFTWVILMPGDPRDTGPLT